ncbi:LysR family transcriptional regulator, partial [Microbacterium sp. ZXX196]|nr:LysR family transcriptional regulator [Microbacterium sp. ZXX196]
EADLGLVYDYSLVPRTFPDEVTTRELGDEPMLLIRPTGDGARPGPAHAEVRALAGTPWITNSRGSADDELALRMCAICGFVPRIHHRI